MTSDLGLPRKTAATFRFALTRDSAETMALHALRRTGLDATEPADGDACPRGYKDAGVRSGEMRVWFSA